MKRTNVVDVLINGTNPTNIMLDIEFNTGFVCTSHNLYYGDGFHVYKHMLAAWNGMTCTIVWDDHYGTQAMHYVRKLLQHFLGDDFAKDAVVGSEGCYNFELASDGLADCDTIVGYC